MENTPVGTSPIDETTQGQQIVQEINEGLVGQQEPVTETPVEEKVEPTPEPVPEPAPEVIPERPSSKHFKTLKAEKDQAQRERDELMHMLQEERSRHQMAPKEDDFGIDENNFAEGKDLKKIAKEMREIKQELAQYKQKSTIQVTEARLMSEYPDFQNVFSEENIELLREEHPEIAETILNSQADPYKVAKSAYKMIKKLGIHVEDTSASKRATVQTNLAKPRPAASISPRQSGSSPLTQANEYGSDDLTEARLAQLRAEVDRYRR